jgi:Fanconi anemia group J protein
VGVIPAGPQHSLLLGTFKVTDTFSYQDDVGEAILEIIRKIPYGVLCFVTSYHMLDKLQQRWEMTGLWNEFKKEKEVFVGKKFTN